MWCSKVLFQLISFNVDEPPCPGLTFISSSIWYNLGDLTWIKVSKISQILEFDKYFVWCLHQSYIILWTAATPCLLDKSIKAFGSLAFNRNATKQHIYFNFQTNNHLVYNFQHKEAKYWTEIFEVLEDHLTLPNQEARYMCTPKQQMQMQKCTI
jgi:hypothetical protein